MFCINKLLELNAITPEVASKLRGMVETDAGSVAEKIRIIGSSVENTSTRIGNFGNSISGFGSALTLLANLFNNGSESSQRFAGAVTALGGTLMTLGTIIKTVHSATKTIPWVAIASGIITIISGVTMMFPSVEKQIENLKKKAEELSNTAKQVKADEKTLQTGYDKLKQLEAARYESAEAAQEYRRKLII